MRAAAIPGPVRSIKFSVNNDTNHMEVEVKYFKPSPKPPVRNTYEPFPLLIIDISQTTQTKTCKKGLTWQWDVDKKMYRMWSSSREYWLYTED